MILRSRRIRTWAVVCVALLVSLAFAREEPAEGDVLLRAMTDELQRSMTLALEGLEQPYFIEYVVEDTVTHQVSASFGAIVSADRDHSRILRTQVRVGSYELDNTNFGGGGFAGMGRGGRGGGFFGGGGAVPLPLDDDYAAIRQAIWLDTDGRYKSAVETLADKRATLQERDTEERPADFTKVEPVRSIAPNVTVAFDEAAWKDRLRAATAIFANYPEIEGATGRVAATAENRTLVNSEGTRLRDGAPAASLVISAEARAEDGETVSDRIEFQAASPADLPSDEALRAAATALAERVTAIAKAPILEDYTGPVLLDGEAAPQVFRELLARGLGAQPTPPGEGRRRFGGGEDLVRYLGKRILPKGLRIYDDPGPQMAGSAFLVGHYLFDEEAVPASRVDLVVDGDLETLLTSRSPTREFAKSNGHARGGGRAGIGTLFVASDEGMSNADLRQALLDAARDEGLDFAIRIPSLRSGAAGQAARIQAMMRGMRGGGGRGGAGAGPGLPDPTYVVKVYVDDGHEEIARGCEFGDVDLRTLRKIVAVGNTPAVDNQGGAGGRGSSSSVVAPAFLVEEMDLFEIQMEGLRKPFLAAPHARSKEDKGN